MMLNWYSYLPRTVITRIVKTLTVLFRTSCPRLTNVLRSVLLSRMLGICKAVSGTDLGRMILPGGT